MKCINCYKEIKDTLKFCNYCGTKQPADRAAYELEHPELADAMPEEEVKTLLEEQERQRQEEERRRQELEEQQRLEEQRRLEEQQRLEEQRRLEEQQWMEQQQQQVIDIPMQEVPEGYAQPVIPSQSDIAPHVTPTPSDGMSTELVVSSPRMAATTKQCFECGQMIPANALVCPNCGAPVQQSYGGSHTEITQMVPKGYQQPKPAATPQQPVINIQSGTSGGNNKKILIAIAAVLAVGILGILGYFLIQRNKATYINTDTKSLYFSRKGGDKSLNVSTDGNYFDVDAPKWLTVNKTESGISFNCGALDGNVDRSGVIIIKSGSQTCHVDVVQRAYATFIRFSEETVEQGRDAGDHNITIDSDGGDFQIASSPDYCTISNLTDQGFTLHVDYNSGKHRDGTIKITDGKNEATLTVSQKGVCSSCGGDGKVTCSKCYGYGEEWYGDWEYGYMDVCSRCNGNGIVRCSKCGGSGIR